MATLVRAEPSSPTERVARGLLAAAGVELVVLVLSGLFLVFYYRPKASTGWWGGKETFAAADAVRVAHRLVSTAFLLTMAALALVGIALARSRSVRRRRHGLTAAAAVAGFVVGLFTSFTGFLLPWDQLALWAVKVGSSARGFRQALDPHRTQYVLLGGSAISVPTFRFWFYVHVLAGPALLVGAGYLAGWRLVGLGAGRNDNRQLDVAAPARPEIGWSD